LVFGLDHYNIPLFLIH